MDWSRAKCLRADPEAFFPDKGQPTTDSKRICNGDRRLAPCPVRDECLQWALDNRERYGIWGGKSERERRAILKERAS